nr:MAG TPA: Dexamethasone-induced [Caudoviricetes sp.]
MILRIFKFKVVLFVVNCIILYYCLFVKYYFKNLYFNVIKKRTAGTIL